MPMRAAGKAVTRAGAAAKSSCPLQPDTAAAASQETFHPPTRRTSMQSRRVFVTRAAAMSAAFATALPTRAQDKGQVIIAAAGGTWQDALREAVFKPFEKATGIKVVEAVGSTQAKLRTMVASGNQEWD